MSRETARYDYTLGSTRESAIVYDDDQKLHNHSDTNPARGQQSAFDLVRLHKYGELDKGIDPATPMTDRPSFKAMIALAESLPEIRSQRAAAEFEDLGELPEPADWLDAPAPVNPSPFRIVEAGEFAGGAYVEPDWLIEELIPARGIGLVWGLSGSDKTGAVFDLMAATHRGVTWRDKAVKRGRSVMVVAEGEYFFANRLRAYAKHRGIDVSELPAVVPCAINLRDGKQVAAFAKELKKLGAAQVWFDTLQQCSPGADENSVKDMGEVISNLKFLAREVGCFAGVVHHAGKNVEKGARGSSAWRPAVDVELYFESDGVHGTMRVEKLKDGPPNTVYPFTRKIIELGTRANGKPITSVVVVQSDQTPIVKSTKLPVVGSKIRGAFDAIKTLVVAQNGPIELEGARVAVVDTISPPEPGVKDRRGGRAGQYIDELLLRGLLFRIDGKLSDTQLVKGADETF